MWEVPQINQELLMRAAQTDKRGFVFCKQQNVAFADIKNLVSSRQTVNELEG